MDRSQDPSGASSLVLRIRPRTVGKIFLTMVAVLVAIHAVCQVVEYRRGRYDVYGIMEWFILWSEATVPTWYSSSSLLVCAALLGLIAWVTKRAGEPGVIYWAGLACLFVFVSLDEAIALHEELVGPVRERLGLGGPLYFAWVVPYGLAMAVLATLYFRFIWALPGRTRALFITAAATFLGGAVGVEMIGSALYEAGDYQRTVPLDIAASVEETLEMLGVAVFIYALCDYMGTRYGFVRISFSEAG